MLVLVTGGAGFIGSHVIEVLCSKGIEVIAIDNLSTGAKDNIPPFISLLEMDVRDASLIDCLAYYQFDAVIHLAAQTMVPVSLEKPRFDCDTNISGTINVLDACYKTNVKRIIFASSAAVYGAVDNVPVKETASTVPTSFYGLSKLTAEKYIALYHQIYELEYVILRFSNVYGERQGNAGEGGVISKFSRSIARSLPVIIFGDGGQTRDFIYAGDVAQAIYLALITQHANSAYNVSTQHETSVRQLITIYEEITETAVTINLEAVRTGDIYRSCLSNQLVREKLGWIPQTSVAAGLRKTYDYFLNSLHNCE